MSQPSPLAVARHRAHSAQAVGDLPSARVLLESALDEARLVLGDDDPAILATAHQLAGVHRMSGDPSAARRVLEEAVAAGQWRLGDADPLMLAISFELGEVAEELGNRHEARRAFGRVAAYGPQVLGDNDPAVRRALDYLGEDPPTVRLTLPDPMPPARPAASPAIPGTTGAPPAPAAPGVWRLPGELPADSPFGQSSSALIRPAPAYARPSRRGRVITAVAVAVAVLMSVVAFYAIVARESVREAGPDREAGAPPTLVGVPPRDVRLRDSGSFITVTWVDPTDSTVSFVVTGGRSGEQLTAMGRLGPGATAFVLQGLNPQLNYCFAVVAVYGVDRFASSPQACTSRAKARPRASGAR